MLQACQVTLILPNAPLEFHKSFVLIWSLVSDYSLWSSHVAHEACSFTEYYQWYDRFEWILEGVYIAALKEPVLF